MSELGCLVDKQIYRASIGAEENKGVRKWGDLGHDNNEINSTQGS